jgi:hypothetical protein
MPMGNPYQGSSYIPIGNPYQGGYFPTISQYMGGPYSPFGLNTPLPLDQNPFHEHSVSIFGYSGIT